MPAFFSDGNGFAGASSQIRSRNEISTDGDVENALKGEQCMECATVGFGAMSCGMSLFA